MNVSKTITGTTGAILAVAMMAMPVFAAKTTPATDKNSAVPAVPRAIPDLIPYHKFDPPTSSMFDIGKLTISGDIRVRPEMRTNQKFGAGQSNTFFVQQWTRLGLNYAVSPDVAFFFQPQYSKNWGSGTGGPGDPNASDGTLFARQAYMLIRNAFMPDLTLKAGRQLVVWGNHRMFGHFDWNNVGWAFDGVTANYKLNASTTLQAGWLRIDETNCGSVTSGGCAGGADARTQSAGAGTPNDTSDDVYNTHGNADADILYVRAPMKIMGMTVEPAYIWHNGGTNRSGNLAGPRPSNQSRHTVGGRVVKKMNVRGARLDSTFEGYYQFGEIGATESVARNQDISAYALHLDAGITLPVPMQPRLGGEVNFASGDDRSNCGTSDVVAGTTFEYGGDCGSKWTGFDQLYPTNHIHFGYMDRMAWKNMLHYSIGLQLRPTKDSHFEVSGHKFYLNDTQDNWYGASQGTFLKSKPGNTEDDLGTEIDAVYTMFFTPDNHVAWQIGGGVFLPGDYVESGTINSVSDPSEETWGYTQLWINF